MASLEAKTLRKKITNLQKSHILSSTWKAKYPFLKAIVAGFRGKVAWKNRTLGVPGSDFPVHWMFLKIGKR